jgi:hypothetical protein
MAAKRRCRAKVYDASLTEGWGIILMGNRRAHYYRNGYPICRYIARWRRPPYDGRLRASRDRKTNCQRCQAALAQERPVLAGVRDRHGSMLWP